MCVLAQCTTCTTTHVALDAKVIFSKHKCNKWKWKSLDKQMFVVKWRDPTVWKWCKWWVSMWHSDLRYLEIQALLKAYLSYQLKVYYRTLPHYKNYLNYSLLISYIYVISIVGKYKTIFQDWGLAFQSLFPHFYWRCELDQHLQRTHWNMNVMSILGSLSMSQVEGTL